MNGCIDIIIAWKNYLASYFKNMQSCILLFYVNNRIISNFKQFLGLNHLQQCIKSQIEIKADIKPRNMILNIANMR